METNKSLYIIALWDGQNAAAYAVVGEDMEKATARAIELCIEDRAEGQESEKEPEFDPELSFEVTCASDEGGMLYDIGLIRRS